MVQLVPLVTLAITVPMGLALPVVIQAPQVILEMQAPELIQVILQIAVWPVIQVQMDREPIPVVLEVLAVLEMLDQPGLLHQFH